MNARLCVRSILQLLYRRSNEKEVTTVQQNKTTDCVLLLSIYSSMRESCNTLNCIQHLARTLYTTIMHKFCAHSQGSNQTRCNLHSLHTCSPVKSRLDVWSWNVTKIGHSSNGCTIHISIAMYDQMYTVFLWTTNHEPIRAALHVCHRECS